METDKTTSISNDRFAHIKGWGIDADPDNDPTYPIRDRSRETHGGMDWPRPAQQEADVEILHSIERPGLSAVFGPANPPKGFSGVLRRLAFKYSESDYRHWLPLLMADRVDIFRGYAEDFKKGHIPNMLKERGFGADWKYDKKKTVARLAIAAGTTAALVTLLVLKSRKK